LKLKASNEAFPGPSDYNVNSILPQDPSYSFGVKTVKFSMFPPDQKIFKRSLSPGPGTYNPSLEQNNCSFL